MASFDDNLQDYVQLMTQHQSAIRAFIVSLMPGSPYVGDVQQEANLVLWKKREQFEHGTKFLAWAFTIARYEVMHHRDKVRKEGKVMISDALIESISELDVEEPAYSEQLLNTLENCISKLKTEEREVVAHRYTKGTNLENLSKMLNKSSGSLRINLFRVRSTLKKCIKANMDMEACS